MDRLPVHTSIPDDKELSNLGTQMVELGRHGQAMRAGHEKTAVERQMNAVQGQIDEAVYDLYSLTEKEVRVVEDATKT
jgi:hypothetical protein